MTPDASASASSGRGRARGRTRVMRDQLTCHAVEAPDKRTWNLEPWWPDVGRLAILAAGCNPT